MGVSCRCAKNTVVGTGQTRGCCLPRPVTNGKCVWNSYGTCFNQGIFHTGLFPSFIPSSQSVTADHVEGLRVPVFE